MWRLAPLWQSAAQTHQEKVSFSYPWKRFLLGYLLLWMLAIFVLRMPVVILPPFGFLDFLRVIFFCLIFWEDLLHKSAFLRLPWATISRLLDLKAGCLCIVFGTSPRMVISKTSFMSSLTAVTWPPSSHRSLVDLCRAPETWNGLPYHIYSRALRRGFAACHANNAASFAGHGCPPPRLIIGDTAIRRSMRACSCSNVVRSASVITHLITNLENQWLTLAVYDLLLHFTYAYDVHSKKWP